MRRMRLRRYALLASTADTPGSAAHTAARDAGSPPTCNFARPRAAILSNDRNYESPEQTRLDIDLGSVVPIDRVTIELAWSGSLPVFETWLSEDAETWYNATPGGINSWNLGADEAHVITLGYGARYIRIVIPYVDESGLSELGGIRQVNIWPGQIDQTQYLTALGSPTTPTPEPALTEEGIPTDKPTIEPTEEVIEEPTEEMAPPEDTPAGDVVPTEGSTPTEEPFSEPTAENDLGDHSNDGESEQEGEPIVPNG